MTNTATHSSPIHVNNFDFLRLAFASVVLVTHSYALAGIKETDLLYQFSHGQVVLSAIGVRGFFIISGYLIMISLLRSRGIKDYYFKRIIRVFPALWVNLALTIAICYFVVDKTLWQYITNHSTPKYMLNGILWQHLQIEGVFENNPYPNTINGSLWTIPYEFFFYMVLSLAFIINRNMVLLRIVTGAFLCFLLALQLFALPGGFFLTTALLNEHIVSLGVLFIAGSFIALFPLPSVRFRNICVVVGFLALLLSLRVGGFAEAQLIILPVLVLSLGTLSYSPLSWVRKYGDISYGIYIWGFVVQQLLQYYFRFDYMRLMLFSIPITLILGYISWHVLEKKVLRLKLHSNKLVS